MRLYLIRHGATEWSVSGQHTGRTDLPLTVEGVRQGRRAGRALAVLRGGTEERLVAFSSPRRRAADTARLVLGEDHEVVLSDDLAEFDYGDYEGITTKAIREQVPGWDIWRDGCPNGETVDDVGRRVDRFLATAVAIDAPTVAFAHGHLLRVLAARAVGLEPRQGRSFSLDTATISVIDDDAGPTAVRLWNLDPRLVVPDP